MEKKLTLQGPHGRQSYTITLPKEWVLDSKLDKSRIVDITYSGDNLIISPFKKKSDVVSIKTSDYPSTIVKVLPGLYRRGVDEIELVIHDPKILNVITELLNNRLIGYEVIERRNESLIIKDITKESNEDFKVILRRLFLLLLELSKCDNKIEAKSLSENIRKLSNYCERVLIKQGHADYVKTPFYYLLIDQIEKISDELEWFFESNNKSNYIKEVIELLNSAYNAFYKFDPKTFSDFTNKAYNLRKEIKISSKITSGLMYIHNIVRIINSMSGTIFSISA